MPQTSLFDLPEPQPVSRVPVEDRERMATLKWRLFLLMRSSEDYAWTLPELAVRTGGLQTSVSMRLREITYEKPEGYTVTKRRDYVIGADGRREARGTFRYRLVKAEE